MSVGLRYSATRANSPPGSCGCFLLQGAALDAAVPIRRNWQAVVEFAGNHAGSVPQTTRALSTLTLLAGPRFAPDTHTRHQVFAQALFGAVRGFDADFRRGNDAADTATGFAYALGVAYELHLSRTLALRVAQVDFVQTNLPNGADGRQRNLRFGAGLTFHVPVGVARR